MGLLDPSLFRVTSTEINLFSHNSTNSSATNYNYEPDRVRAAEIERDTKLRLAEMEAERIELARDAQIELLEIQTSSQIAIEEARARGMAIKAKQLVDLQEKMLDIAAKRIAIIEAGSMSIIRNIENFYSEIIAAIQAGNDEYNTQKLPKFLQILESYEKNSAAYQLYWKKIEREIEIQSDFVNLQLQNVISRQNQVLENLFKTQEEIIKQTQEIVQRIALPSATENLSLSPAPTTPLLT